MRWKCETSSQYGIRLKLTYDMLCSGDRATGIHNPWVIPVGASPAGYWYLVHRLCKKLAWDQSKEASNSSWGTRAPMALSLVLIKAAFLWDYLCQFFWFQFWLHMGFFFFVLYIYLLIHTYILFVTKFLPNSFHPWLFGVCKLFFFWANELFVLCAYSTGPSHKRGSMDQDPPPGAMKQAILKDSNRVHMFEHLLRQVGFIESLSQLQ